MSLLSAISTRRAALPDTENALSLRYLHMLERWLPFGAAQFAPWPDRPNCGHFFGGCHWYGTDTAGPAYACAVAASSPAYDERATGLSPKQLRAMALAGLRYLCFTHDTGPPDCLRPKVGRGRPETWGNKWGERGHGFFNESQGGNTIARLAKTALLLRDDLDAETWELLAQIHFDYEVGSKDFASAALQSGSVTTTTK